MKKLNFFGAGPKIGLIILPFLAIAIALTRRFPSIFTFGTGSRAIMILGIVFLASGLICYGLTVRSLLRGLTETRLVTTGPYRYCQNPLDAVIMLLFIPGVALVMYSWIMLTVPVVGYIAFKKCIRREYSEMTEIFGEAYLDYKKRTPEFFPFLRNS